MGKCSLCGEDYNPDAVSFAKTVESDEEKQYWQLIATAHPECVVKLIFQHGTSFQKKKFFITDLQKTKTRIIDWFEKTGKEDATNFEISRELNIKLEEVDVAIAALETEKILA